MPEIYINGPVNVARLEGFVGSTKKVLYLFMDKHLEGKYQTKCADENAKDIVDFLKNSFLNLNNSDKMYDFLVEIDPSSNVMDISKTQYSEVITKNIYIARIIKFFREFFRYEKSIEKVGMSEIFRNVRFHYIDIRDWLLYYFSIISELLKKSIENKEKVVINVFTEFIEYLEFILDNLKNPRKAEEKQYLVEELPNLADIDKMDWKEKYFKKITYLIHKLMRGYTNKNIQNKIEEYILNVIVPFIKSPIEFFMNNIKNDPNFEYIRNYPSELNKLQTEDEKNKLLDIVMDRYWSMVDGVIIGATSYLMDLYFIRRFLDKDYITNAITYTGNLHSMNYIYVLVNIFNFRVTHASFSIKNNVDDLNKEIMDLHPYFFDKSKYYNIVSYYIHIEDKMLELFDMALNCTRPGQCSDITEFPKNFS